MPQRHPFTCHARLYAGHPLRHTLRVEKWIAGMKPAMTCLGLVRRHRTALTHVMPGLVPGIQAALPRAESDQ
jgi:hypothetical protein